MKIVFCWSNISGYMAACWRELASRSDVELHILAYSESSQSAFGSNLMDGISWCALEPAEREDFDYIHRRVVEQKPDVVVLAGWLNPAYMKLVDSASLRDIRFVMGMDTPWRATIRQYLAPYVLRRFVARLSAVFVPGERAWQFARRLGVPPARIHRGMYGVNWDRFGAAVKARNQKPWPRRFLFAGRYEQEKGVDTLIEAYELYRKQAEQPWELHLCGMGSLQELLRGAEGVTDHGFLQPRETLELMSECGALVLPSRYDPWPLVVVEGAAAGLPLIVSEVCGSAVEILRPEYNGLYISPEASAAELASLMVRFGEIRDLPDWSVRSRFMTEAYAARFWADRWLVVCGDVLEEGANG